MAERARFGGVTTASSTMGADVGDDDRDYDHLLKRLRDTAEARARGATHLFTVDTSGLWRTFIDSLPVDMRQHHTCHACRQFVERYGGLVVVDENGATTSLVWADGAPGAFGPAVSQLRRVVQKLPIVAAFDADERVLGTPVTGKWRHMAIDRPVLAGRTRPRTQTPSQWCAEVRENAALLHAAIERFPLADVTKAIALLPRLPSGERVREALLLLSRMHDTKGRERSAKAWVAAASSPALCHLAAGAPGALLELVAKFGTSDRGVAQIVEAFREVMSPLKYLRPQATTAGNVQQAERIVATLGLERSLARRFATIDEVEAEWRRPALPKPPTAGVFAHIAVGKAKQPTDVGGSPIVMTWSKFAREVLPLATAIDARASGRLSFAAFVTAVHADAPPLLQWDREEARNPVSWYVYVKGSTADEWSLRPGEWWPVVAVTRSPEVWRGRTEYTKDDGPAAHLLLEGCRDRKHENGGSFFPSMLRSELHAVRATLEAHARLAIVGGIENATACGLRLTGDRWGVTLRVTANGVRTLYTIDRFD